jgi:pyruvate dehydrogenase E2 component (dihydrolipoamide acetyltransferase)
LARKLAAEKGVDFSHLEGSGPGGRIVQADILAAAKHPGPPAGPPSALSGAPSLLAKGPIQNDELVSVSNMRATIARRLVESKTQIPHFYLEVEIDAEPLLALRVQLNAGLEKDGVKLSINDFILKAAAEALRVVPAVNCSWEVDPSGQPAIRHHAATHVAFAVAIEDGLITPVIRDTHRKTVFQISTEARELAALAKAKKLKPEQFSGGTFCLSNLGMMGVERFTTMSSSASACRSPFPATTAWSTAPPAPGTSPPSRNCWRSPRCCCCRRRQIEKSGNGENAETSGRCGQSSGGLRVKCTALPLLFVDGTPASFAFPRDTNPACRRPCLAFAAFAKMKKWASKQ